jgi:2,3-bisphosphoglycerate-dependent phosphoglycerate mutase
MKWGIEMEILVIRHGQSEADLLDVHEGRADFPLTPFGELQAKKMAQYVGTHFPPDIILTSPLKRAKRTAELLNERIDCSLIEDKDLMEFNNGVLAGVPKKVAAKKYPLPVNGRPAHIPIQNGESELEFRYRAERVYSRVTTDYYQYRRIAIVSHGGFISNFLKACLSLPYNSDTVFSTGDTGMHLFEVKAGSKVMRFLNRQEHLLLL